MNIVDSGLKKVYETEVVKIEKNIKVTYDNKNPKSLYTPYSYLFQNKGKLLRPLLVLLSAKAVGGNYSDVRNAAAAVELAHMSSLVHDDIMDNSSTRRGSVTLHDLFGINTAILVGDTLIFNAYLSLLKDSSRDTKKIFEIFTKAAVQICEGQSLDIDFEKKENIFVKDYTAMIYKKTAVLIETSCLLGAYISGGDKNSIKAISDYGKFLGMAFQIQDDLLDISSDEIVFGKKIGTDFLNNKKTYINLLFLERASDSQKESILLLKNSKINRSKAIKIFKDACLNLGILKDAELEILKYSKRALKSLDCLPNNDGKKLLVSLLEEVLGRER
jgi:geranylgeranyl pyrophosphate synthase